MKATHILLDGIGVAPVVGWAADGVNGLIYAAKTAKYADEAGNSLIKGTSKKIHGNSLGIPKPTDVYVVRERRTGKIIRFGETTQSYKIRGRPHRRRLSKLDIEVETMDISRLITRTIIKRGRITSTPQTSIRTISKKFRLLYSLEDRLNIYIERNACDSGEIKELQIFFDTDLTDENVVKILDLKGGILQVETSLNWEEFSQLEFSEQQVEFINKIYGVVKRVLGFYSLNQERYDKAFKELFNDMK
ncbi:MAG TPA: hypothetical protein VF199_15575 [Bacillales bacterium]